MSECRRTVILGRTLSRDINKLLDILVPHGKHIIDAFHEPFKRRVVHKHDLVAREDLEQLVVEIARDGLDEGQRAAKRVGSAAVALVEEDVGPPATATHDTLSFLLMCPKMR